MLYPSNISQIKHDQEAKDGLQRIGLPEVYPLHLSRYCDLTEKWQWFWFRQLIHSYTGFVHWDETKLTKTELDMLKGKWASLTADGRAFTNFKGTKTCEDFIRNVNVGAGLPGQEPLICCGNIVKVLGDSVQLAGVMKTPIETLDGSKPPPPIERINRLTAPHLIFCATNVSPIILPDGRYRIDRFPQFDPRDTLVALRTNGKDADELKARNVVSVAGTYTKDGVSYAVNYIKTHRLSKTITATPYVP